MMKWLIEEGLELREGALIAAAMAGNEEVISWLRNQEREGEDIYKNCTSLGWDFNLIQGATQGGQLDLLLKRSVKLDNIPQDTAIGYHQLDLLKYLYKNGIVPHAGFMARACAAGSLEIVKYGIEELNLKLSEKDILSSIARGHLHLVKWFHERGEKIPEDACTWAARSGNLVLLQWLAANGHKMDADIVDNTGNQNWWMVKWLIEEKKYPMTQKACKAIASSGQKEVLAMLKYLHARGFTWNSKKIARQLMKGGTMKTLKWAMDHGCDWSVDLYRLCPHAGIYGVKFVFEEQGMDFEKCPPRATIVDRLIAYNDFQSLQWLTEQGVTWTTTERQKMTRDPRIEKLSNLPPVPKPPRAAPSRPPRIPTLPSTKRYVRATRDSRGSGFLFCIYWKGDVIKLWKPKEIPNVENPKTEQQGRVLGRFSLPGCVNMEDKEPIEWVSIWKS